MAEKLEFGSPQWMDMLEQGLHDVVAEAGDAVRGVTYSMCEIYQHPPAHLAPATGELGWHVRIDDGKVEFRPTPTTDCDVVITSDYQAILALARFETGGGPDGDQRMAEFAMPLMARGELKIEGDMTKRPPFMEPLHDRLAARTL